MGRSSLLLLSLPWLLPFQTHSQIQDHSSHQLHSNQSQTHAQHQDHSSHQLHSNQFQTHAQHQDHSSHQLHSNQLSQTHVQPHNHKLLEDAHQHGHGDVQFDELADVPDVIVVVVTAPVSVSQQNSDVKKLITKTVEQ